MNINQQLPPHDIKAEKAVIGAVLLERRAITNLLDYLRGDVESVNVFYDLKHQTILRAIFALHEAGDKIDILTVKNMLSKSGRLDQSGGAEYLSEVMTEVASGANVGAHLAIVGQAYMRREMVKIGQRANLAARDETSDIFELREKLVDSMDKLLDPFVKRTSTNVGAAIDDHVAKIKIMADKIRSGIQNQMGITTGFPILDFHTGGYCPEQLWAIGARTGMGKTAFMLSSALIMAMAGHPVLLIALEISQTAMINRLISMLTGIANWRLARATLSGTDLKKLDEVVEMFHKLPIFIEDAAGFNISDVLHTGRFHKRKKGTEVIFADYAQLLAQPSSIRGYDNNKTQTIADASGKLRTFVNKEKCCFVMFSQFNQDVKKRGNRIPILGDFAGSDVLPQSATHAAGLYRPGYFNRDEPTYAVQAHPGVPVNILNNYLGFHLFKQSEGPVGAYPLEFIGSQTKVQMPTNLQFLEAWGEGIKDQKPEMREAYRKMLIASGVDVPEEVPADNEIPF